MKPGKNHQEEEEEEDEEFCGKRDAMPSTNLSKDGKSSDKANVTRSKHSVTEQRRRSKINERYQILRGLIPDSDQKRDTASFLLEVIHYVQFLQEKVQKYEGSYQTWSSEPTKLMPWRNSHWPAHNFVSQPQTIKSGPCATFPGRVDENSALRHSGQQNPVELEAPCGSIDQETELSNSAMGIPLHLQANLPNPSVTDGAFSHVLHGPPPDGPPTECPSACDALNHQGELTVEGGTISISSVYSQRLLNSLTQALELTGLDLSQATVSVQINLGRQVDGSSISGIRSPKDHAIPVIHQDAGAFQEAGGSEGVDRAQKRQKT